LVVELQVLQAPYLCEDKAITYMYVYKSHPALTNSTGAHGSMQVFERRETQAYTGGGLVLTSNGTAMVKKLGLSLQAIEAAEMEYVSVYISPVVDRARR
jgi:hypothetical protein